MVGTVIAGYRITDALGAGGMGEVYVGEHQRIVRRVAIKFLLKQLTGDREVVDRFFAEARATSSISHPGIVEIFDCDVDRNGRAYIVMELLSGESLASRLERDPAFGRDIDRPLAVADQMASALAAAHANGIIHRDLKPDNVFLTLPPDDSPSTFCVKILDFGIAKLLAHTEAERAGRVSLTIPGSLLGTPKYMSPEQCCDASNVDHRADVYSLGCILFETLSGRPPFAAQSFAELVAAQLGQVPPPLGTLRDGIPPRVEALVGRMLAKNPEDRPSTMEEVRREIAVARAEIATAPVTRTRFPEKPPVASASEEEPAPQMRRLSGPRRAAVVFSVAAVLVSGGLLVLAQALGHRHETNPPQPVIAPNMAGPAPAAVPAVPAAPAPAVPEPARMSTEPTVAAPAPVMADTPAQPSAAISDRGAAVPSDVAASPRKTPPATPTSSTRQRRPSNPEPPDLSDEARKL